MNFDKQPISFYYDQVKHPLIFNLFNVGEGLMILIVLPNDTTILYDCNVTEENEKDIIEQLDKYIPEKFDSDELENKKYIDIFINSHRDDDHLRGLKKVHSNFEIKSIWDSGQTGASTSSNTYQYYMRLRRSIMSKYGNDYVIIPLQSNMPMISYGLVDIYCLNSGQKEQIDSALRYIKYSDYQLLLESKMIKEARIQHSNSLVFLIKYANRSILLTGDSDWLAWKSNIVPNLGDIGLLKADILVASHHGSRSFFTDEEKNDSIDPRKNPDSTYLESLDYIQPNITLIPCGKYKTAHHPNKEALSIYKNNTFNKQVYTTNGKGHLLGIIDVTGNWTICPSRFFKKSNVSRDVNINCTYSYNGKKYLGRSGGKFPIGSKINFSLTSNWGAFDPISEINVWFEVSNGGIGDHHMHQEIYYKQETEEDGKLDFSREVSYLGKHLLRCRIQNKAKKIYITEIFIVNGI